MRKLQLKRILWVVFPGVLAAADYYVHNLEGRDDRDGLSPATALHTVEAALARCQLGEGQDRVFLLPSHEPYRGTILIENKGYDPEAPLVIDGGGNWLVGSVPVSPGEWKRDAGHMDIYFLEGVRDNQGKSDDFFFVIINGVAQMMGRSRLQQDIATPEVDDLEPGEWTIRSGRLYVRLRPGFSIRDSQIELVKTKIGVHVAGPVNSVEIRNIRTKFFWADGFGLHGQGQDIRIHEVEGSYNWNQGISSHGSTRYVLRDAVFLGNMEGLVNVHHSESENYQVLQADSWNWEFKFRDPGHHRFFDSFFYTTVLINSTSVSRV